MRFAVSAGMSISPRLGLKDLSFDRRELGDNRATVIASQTEIGALYGSFHFLRLIQPVRADFVAARFAKP